ncbi:MAG: SDR family NAD(P)-dependent oxidoreductase [Myxococcota bacterium]|nr:SDR family NAD(P)-dependent oxidoreductase [Myxococcota bacterium]
MAQPQDGGTRSLGPDSTAEEAAAGVDLTGRVAVVTGASGGLGEETARVLAARGARVVMAARSRARGEDAAARIRDATPDARLEVQELELASPDSVRRFAARVREAHPAIHLLVNNAGVMACPLERTPEGFELQFATNHLGHFLLTAELAPALRAGAPARGVSVSSAGHRFSPVVFEDVHYRERPYDKWEAYGQSKTANVLFAVEADRRLGPHGVRVNALHPGAIVTDLGRHLTAEDRAALQARAGTGSLRWKTVPQGAATTLFAATAPELEGRGGLYLEDCAVAARSDDPAGSSGVMPWALEPEAARRLFEISESMLGVRFPA